MPRIAVKPALLEWAAERSGKTADELRARFRWFDEWLAEDKQPTLKQLELFANATRTPFGYFFLDVPPADVLPVPYFRTGGAARRPSADLIETVQTMERRQAWLREAVVEDGEAVLAFIGSARVDANVVALAQEIRERLGFAAGWAMQVPTWTDALRFLRDAIEGIGVSVATNGIVGNNTHRKLDPGEFRGFVLVDRHAPLVFVNGADAKSAQMFTLAHELIHLWLGSSAIFDLSEMRPANDATEQFCDRVAAEFLVPAAQLTAAWGELAQGAQPFLASARRFKVSPIVTARRALDLGLITRDAFMEFYTEHMNQVRADRGQQEPGGDFYASQGVRLGKRFSNAVLDAVSDGRLTYRGAYELTGMWGETFDNYFAEVRRR